MADVFESFVINVARAHKYIQYIKKQETRVFGLKGFHVMCLYYLDKNPGGLTVTELSKKCCEDKAAVSRTLDSLVKSGYVVRQETISGTRRRQCVKLTPEGRHIAVKVVGVINDVTGLINDGMSDEENIQFYRTFAKINRRLANYCAGLGTAEKDALC